MADFDTSAQCRMKDLQYVVGSAATDVSDRHGVKIFSSNDILQFHFCYLPTHSSVIVQYVNIQSYNVHPAISAFPTVCCR